MEKKDRLAAAKEAAAAIRAAIPEPEPKRTATVLLNLTDEEKQRLLKAAAKAGHAPATYARLLMLAALQATEGKG